MSTQTRFVEITADKGIQCEMQDIFSLGNEDSMVDEKKNERNKSQNLISINPPLIFQTEKYQVNHDELLRS